MNRRTPVNGLPYIVPPGDTVTFIGLGDPNQPGPYATYRERGVPVPAEGATHGVFEPDRQGSGGDTVRRMVPLDHVIDTRGNGLGRRFRPYGDLQAGDQFLSPREDEGIVKVVCPPGTCRHEVRDVFSCHVRGITHGPNEWFVVADPGSGTWEGDLVEVPA